MNQNSNQFTQSAIPGALDLHLASSGVITGMVSANQSGNIIPGDRVMLDTVSGGQVPSFVTVANSAVAIGTVAFTSRKSAANYAAGDMIEVVLLTGTAPIMYLAVSAAAIVAGAYVASAGAGTGAVITNGGVKQMGIALDGGAVGALIRVILSNITL